MVSYFMVEFFWNHQKPDEVAGFLINYSSDPLMAMLDMQRKMADNQGQPRYNRPCILYESDILPVYNLNINTYIPDGMPGPTSGITAWGVTCNQQLFFFEPNVQQQYDKLLTDYTQFKPTEVPAATIKIWADAFRKNDGTLQQLLRGSDFSFKKRSIPGPLKGRQGLK